MQSTTTGVTTGTESYGPCMVSVGEWCVTEPNLTEQQKTSVQTAYNTIYNTYLQARYAAATAVRAVRTGQQPATYTQTTQRRTGAAATRRAESATTRRAASATTPRVRTPQGQLGQVDSRVLNQIVSNPNISTEQLRKRASLRNMQANILGTCLGRLLKTSMITGTPKIGPFSATPQGITAVRKEPTSIGAARARRTAATTPTTEQVAAAG